MGYICEAAQDGLVGEGSNDIAGLGQEGHWSHPWESSGPASFLILCYLVVGTEE